MDVDIRLARDDDLPFLREVLLLAVNWNPARQHVSAADAFSSPEIAHYLEAWPGPRDGGVIASSNGLDVGAAWWRHFTADDPGYGFVATDVPEITIGVTPHARGRGVGRTLLMALHDLATARGLERLSLSVEKANSARRLYRSLGYEEITDDGTAVTMVAALRSAVDDDPR